MVTLWLWIGHGSVVMKIDQSPDWDLWIVAFVFHSIWSTVCVNSTCMNIDNLYSMSHYDHYRTYSSSQTYILVYRSPSVDPQPIPTKARKKIPSTKPHSLGYLGQQLMGLHTIIAKEFRFDIFFYHDLVGAIQHGSKGGGLLRQGEQWPSVPSQGC